MQNLQRTKPMSKAAAKLAERAREIGVKVPDWIEIRRTRAGHHQRSAGAWSWWACDVTGREVMGSVYSVAALLKAARIEVSSIYASPELHPIYKIEDPSDSG